MKSFGTIIICTIIGGILGFMVGAGESSYTKKSVRETTFPIFAIVGILGGAILGAVIANKINSEEKNNNAFGFKSFETFEGKAGRKWFIQTKWINPQTGNENKITTEFLTDYNSVVTSLNNTIVSNHKLSDGSKEFIQKTHIQALNSLKQEIMKSNFKLV